MSVKGNGVFTFCLFWGYHITIVSIVDGVSGHCYTMYSGEGYRKD